MLVTKLKNSKWLVGIISILIIGMISGWLCSNYEKMGKIAQERAGSVYDNSELYQYLSQMSYTLYYNALKQENLDVSSEDLFEIDEDNLEWLFEIYGLYDATDISIEEFYDLSKNEQHQILMNALRPIVEEDLTDSNWIFSKLQNIEYFVTMPSNESNIKIGSVSLESLLNPNLSESQLEPFKSQYQAFVVLNYDVNGSLNISNSYGMDAEVVNSSMKYNDFMDQDRVELSPIKNMTFVYAIPKTLVYQDYIWQMTYRYDWWSIQSVVGMFSGIAIALTVITSIVLPIKAFKQSKILNRLFNIPVEVVTFISIFLIPIFVELLPSLVQSTLEGDLIGNSAYGILSEDLHNMIVPILNTIIWLAVLYCVFLDCLYIKNLFKIGLKETIKTKFIIINCLRWCGRKMKAAYRTLTDIDLKNANTKKLALFMVIQFIIISILCLTWFIGPFIAIVYVGFLFFYLNQKLKKVESNYSRLFVVTNELAEGNLDVQVDEDLGMFNSFKEEVVNIQSGFKKAVQNELKSQRMKTDLIANVSHDLKTPLTSIITYVDLLKDENLAQEKRVQYLETLDQKSQRLKVLIEDLFEMSKASSGNISMNLQMVDVVALMKQTLLETEDKTEASELVIRRQFPEHKVMLSLDSERTFRVFENLISNMSKYAMSGTRAYIDILDNEDTVQIIFRNMSADEITVNVEELVERFVRGDQSRHTEGSGLGLAIAKSFVELQGGHFEVLIDGDLFKVMISFNK